MLTRAKSVAAIHPSDYITGALDLDLHNRKNAVTEWRLSQRSLKVFEQCVFNQVKRRWQNRAAAVG